MKMTVTVKLSQAQIKNSAAVSMGIDPRAMGQKPGGRVHRDRKRDAARGRVKHRNRVFD